MQPRYVCTLKMGYCLLSCGWMEIRFNIASYITVSICYPQVRVLECLLRELALHFTACLPTNCSSDVNTTAKCWCILLKRTNIIWMFEWKCGTSFCYHTKEVFENRCSCPWHTHCGLYSLHMIVQIWQSFAIRQQKCSQWQLPFHCRLHLLIRKYSLCIQ
jgi:hypothetical protein